MSRQRLNSSLRESSYHVCPRCSGSGTIRDNESLSLSILRLIEEEALKENTHEVHVIVPIEIACYLLNEKREAVNAIEKRQSGGKTIIIPNKNMKTPQYSISRIRKNEAFHTISYCLSKISKSKVHNFSKEQRLEKKKRKKLHLNNFIYSNLNIIKKHQQQDNIFKKNNFYNILTTILSNISDNVLKIIIGIKKFFFVKNIFCKIDVFKRNIFRDKKNIKFKKKINDLKIKKIHLKKNVFSLSKYDNETLLFNIFKNYQLVFLHTYIKYFFLKYLYLILKEQNCYSSICFNYMTFHENKKRFLRYAEQYLLRKCTLKTLNINNKTQYINYNFLIYKRKKKFKTNVYSIKDFFINQIFSNKVCNDCDNFSSYNLKKIIFKFHVNRFSELITFSIVLLELEFFEVKIIFLDELFMQLEKCHFFNKKKINIIYQRKQFQIRKNKNLLLKNKSMYIKNISYVFDYNVILEKYILKHKKYILKIIHYQYAFKCAKQNIFILRNQAFLLNCLEKKLIKNNQSSAPVTKISNNIIFNRTKFLVHSKKFVFTSNIKKNNAAGAHSATNFSHFPISNLK
jgi:ribonuclease E